MRKSHLQKVILLACIILPAALFGQEKSVSLTVHPSRIAGKINEKIYGHFLEHIYHSVNGGIWGEVVWNRSFEECMAKGNWRINNQDKTIITSAPEKAASQFLIGDEKWRDYEASVEFRKTEDEGDVLVGVRNTLNRITLALGDSNNTRQSLVVAAQWNFINLSQDIKTVQSLKGSIAKDRWYNLVVRCDKQRVQAWLDGQSLFDYQLQKTDPQNGRLSLGAINTVAEFRNIKVKSLSKDSLAPVITPARHWYVTGDCQVSPDTSNPLNGHVSVKIAANESEGGLYQQNFNARKGDTLQGSVWLRGKSDKGIIVRLMNRDKVLAQQVINHIDPEWKEYPLRLASNADCDTAQLQIVSNGKTVAWVDQLSLMPASAGKTGGFRADLFKAMQDLKPAIIRWPGGTFVSHYDWEHGIGPQKARIGKSGWDEMDPLAFGLDEFLRLCEKLKSEPVVVVHVGYNTNKWEREGWLKKTLNWMEYCNGDTTTPYGKLRAQNGHPAPYNVKYWELDNEVWIMQQMEYVKIIRQFAPEMRKKDSTIKIIACGSGYFNTSWKGSDTLIINNAAEHIDYLSIHNYEDPAHFLTGIPYAEKYWNSLSPYIAKSKNPRVKLFFSEWNAQSTDWRTGLYAAGMLNAMERTPLIDMATPALWLRHVKAPAWDNAFINFNQSKWFGAPNYKVMKLWHEHFAPYRIEMNGSTDSLNVIATKSVDGSKVFIKAVNPLDRNVAVDIKLDSGFVLNKTDFKLISAGFLSERNTIEQPQTIEPVTITVNQEGDDTIKFILPKWSAGVVTAMIKKRNG
ncbi:family 16 glycoside hydrolase [Foetidibacter luteolus]|uniref:family 16 glycoside hydrolase n=1 Tax=Foetidibacter luteolus TaxID=2608880 RepID=UPI00129A11DD|nr:family 16 glycoside hydrolase [Foetidibacter luteolus]